MPADSIPTNPTAVIPRATHGPPDIPIITRAEARAAGLRKYYTGKPCSRGHFAERLVKNADCSECDRLRRDAKKQAGLGPRPQQPARGTIMAEDKDTPEIRPATIDKRLDAIQAEQRAMREEWRQQSVTLRDIYRDFKAALARLEQRMDDSIEQRLVDTVKRADALERSAGGED